MTKLLLAYSLAQSFADTRFMTFTILKAVLLAAFTWALCGYSMWLWNRRFQMRLIHHSLCAFAAVVTMVSIFMFQCLGEIKSHALKDLKHWQETYLSDQRLEWKNFVEAYENVQQLYRQNGWELDAQKYLEPPREIPSDPSKYLLPVDRQEAREICLKIFCDRAVENLAVNQPILSQILSQDSHNGMGQMRKFEDDFQRENPGGVFNAATSSLRIAGKLFMDRLASEVSTLVFWLRLELVVIFALAQLVAFGLAGHSAYCDIRIH